MQNALEIKNLTKKYNDFVLDDINITLPSGCIMGFIGENGAGKSTTVKLILDLIKKDSGTIKVLGMDNANADKNLKEQIGVVMDESGFPDNLNAAEINNIMKSCYKTWDEDKFLQYMKKFTIPDKRAIKDYSRGMKMKLNIAVALSHGSKILILDEATSGLDPIIRDEILDVFLDFIQDDSHSIFISSHIISDLEKICDYITFIHKGKVVFSEAKDELSEKYVIVKCGNEQYESLDKNAIIGARKNSFNTEALMLREFAGRELLTEKPSIEDIMLYFVKEVK